MYINTQESSKNEVGDFISKPGVLAMYKVLASSLLAKPGVVKAQAAATCAPDFSPAAPSPAANSNLLQK